LILYHGGTEVITKPIIIKSEYGRDFGFGFYTTSIKEQAQKWAHRQARIRGKQAVLNSYELDEIAFSEISLKKFTGYSMQWLDFVVACRSDINYRHDFDIVIGNIADDDVGVTVQSVVDGIAPKDFALQKLSYFSDNDQICFCTMKALEYLKFVKSEVF
jgi:hypothetical protein